MRQKNFTWSKLLLIVTTIIFAICVGSGFTATIHGVYDTTIYVAAITVSGGCWGTTVVNYLKKAQSENAFKLRMELYRQSTDTRLYFNEEMMKLQQKYGTTQEDIDAIDNNGDIDEMMGDALMSATSEVDSTRDEADASIELQTY